MKRDQLRQYDKGGVALVDYFVPEFRGKAIRQQTIHAYLGGSNLCAEVHLSKEQFVPHDEKLLDDVLGTVRLLLDQSAREVSDQKEQLLAEGSNFYLRHHYGGAAQRTKMPSTWRNRIELSTRLYSACSWTIWYVLRINWQAFQREGNL